MSIHWLPLTMIWLLGHDHTKQDFSTHTHTQTGIYRYTHTECTNLCRNDARQTKELRVVQSSGFSLLHLFHDRYILLGQGTRAHNEGFPRKPEAE